VLSRRRARRPWVAPGFAARRFGRSRRGVASRPKIDGLMGGRRFALMPLAAVGVRGRMVDLPRVAGNNSLKLARSPSTTGKDWDRRIAEMTLRIGDTAPNFEAQTTAGPINFHDWIGDSWAVLFSHPKDFTPVCTTELGYMAKIKPDFDKRNVKIIGLSVDPVEQHARWANDIRETQGYAPNYPMIGDPELMVSKLYGMLPAASGSTSEGRTAADNQTVRTVFVIGPDKKPDKKIELILAYPMTTGRNFDEVLRVIDSLQLTAKHKVATPVNWKDGEDVIIAGSVSEEEAKKQYPKGWKAPKPYIRIVPQPR
jgi:thioredoxin-dependent peroxiredoxin